MKLQQKLLSILLMAGLVFFMPPAWAKSKKKSTPSTPSPTYDTQSLVSAINQIVQSSGGKAAIGIQVKSMKHGDILYSKNSQQTFTPASVVKILTAEAALLSLGPDYQFTTRLMTNATATHNGILAGDLFLVHSGDPTLSYYDLADLMVAIKSQQVQGLSGNFYIDNTAYDQENFGPGWPAEDKRYCYAAPINASIINHNCISFEITPAKTVGQLANIIQSPRYYYSGIENAVVTKTAHAKCSVHLNSSPNNIINVTGCMKKGYYSQGASIVVNNIIEYNKSLMQSLFKRFDMRMGGTFDAKKVSPDSTLLAMHQSKPLHLLVNDMLKNSNNIIASSLFKKMGQVYSRQPGSWTNSKEAVSQILAQRAALNITNLRVVDGSGLSRENKVTPSQLMQALDFAFHNYAINYEFISALPIAGVDGTLKHRLQNVAWKVRAKTGTMKGIASLAGFAVAKNKEPLAFVIIVNDPHGNGWKNRELEDKIITALTRYSR